MGILVDELSAIAAAFDASEQPAATYQAVDTALQRIVSHRLLTILIYNEALTESVRLYSSCPEVYPPHIRSDIASTAWAESVVRDGVPYIGNTVQDLELVFSAHREMAALGLGSVVNMPIRWRRATVGTVNILGEERRYAHANLETIRMIAQLVLPALLQDKQDLERMTAYDGRTKIDHPLC